MENIQLFWERLSYQSARGYAIMWHVITKRNLVPRILGLPRNRVKFKPKDQLMSSIQLFWERLSYQSTWEYTTMPKGIMGNGGLRRRDWCSGCFRLIKGNSTHSCICIHAFSFLLGEIKWSSSLPSQNNAKLSLPIIPIRIVMLFWSRTTFVETAVYVICRLGGPYGEKLWPRAWYNNKTNYYK